MFCAGVLVIGQFTFWGNMLPRYFPVHLRGTGESFAANIGGRLIGTSFAFVVFTITDEKWQGYSHPFTAGRLCHARGIYYGRHRLFCVCCRLDHRWETPDPQFGNTKMRKNQILLKTMTSRGVAPRSIQILKTTGILIQMEKPKWFSFPYFHPLIFLFLLGSPLSRWLLGVLGILGDQISMAAKIIPKIKGA